MSACDRISSWGTVVAVVPVAPLQLPSVDSRVTMRRLRFRLEGDAGDAAAVDATAILDAVANVPREEDADVCLVVVADEGVDRWLEAFELFGFLVLRRSTLSRLLLLLPDTV